MKLFFLKFLLMLLIMHNIAAQDLLEHKAYRFDPGDSSDLNSESIYLSKEDMYSSHKGFGWTTPPQYEFRRDKLSRYRNEFTIDGVTGKTIGFKADLPAGEWQVTAWIEAGVEDSSTIQILINQKNEYLNWQIFNPPAEPRSNIQKVYRIFNRKFSVEDKFEIVFEGGNDSVRLLGMDFISLEKNNNENYAKLFDQIQIAGRYNSTYDLREINQQLEEAMEENPSHAFAHHWHQQIDLLIEAEELVKMGGWEWTTKKTGMGIFDKFHQAVMIFDALLLEENLLYDRALWGRARLLYWLDRERGGIHEEQSSRKDLSELREKFPDDQLIAMYTGEKIKSFSPCDTLVSSPNAPQWSILQREALCRLTDEIDWWVNEKQANNGELGGKLGDDVEILRGWTPAILWGHKAALKGWVKLAECVWESPMVYKGYARDPDDVEHSSEFISDTTPELVFFTDDEKYVERLKYSVDYFQTLWTGIADNGERHFRSAWFSSTEVDTTPPKNRDLDMNARAVKAVRYYAWKTGDKSVIDQLHQWSSAWLKAAMRNDRNKPVGVFPASISFPDAELNGNEETWHTANMYWNYFDWSHSAGAKLYDQLLFTYVLTGDSSLMMPLFHSLELIDKHKNGNQESEVLEGSEEWAANILISKKEFWNTVAQYRFNSTDKRYDNLILKHGTPYSKYRLTGEIKFIEEALTNYLENIRYNSPLRTTEVLHTDRVYYPGSDEIKAMLTGDGTNEGLSPYYSVSWENTDDSFTALVDDASNTGLSLQVFSHSAVEKKITMRIWQLKPGSYSIELMSGNISVETRQIEIRKKGERVELSIPPNQLIRLKIRSI